MARTEVYTCDICKQSKSKDDLANFKVSTTGIKTKSQSNGYHLTFDICPACLEKKGFVVECKKEEEEKVAAKNQVALEDKIYDFLVGLGVVFQE